MQKQDTIKQLLAEGMTYEDLRLMLTEMEETEKAKENEALISAREALVEAVINYFVELKLITKEELVNIDMTDIMVSIEEGEKELKDMLSTFSRLGGVLNGMGSPRVSRPRVATTSGASPDDILKNFLNGLEGLK